MKIDLHLRKNKQDMLSRKKCSFYYHDNTTDKLPLAYGEEVNIKNFMLQKHF